MENATKSKENATKMPEGTEKKPKGHHQRAQRATRVPPRCKSDDKRSPKGTQRAPKGDQNGPKMHPAALLEKNMKTNEFLTAKMLQKGTKNSLEFIKQNMRRRTSRNLKKHCISAVKTLKSRSRHRQKASKTAAKNQSKK